MTALNSTEINQEFLVRRYKNGIQLFRPTYDDAQKNLSVENMFALPLNVFFLNSNHELQNLNEHAVFNCGWQLKHGALGNTVEKVLKKNAAHFSLSHNSQVMQMENFIMKDELFLKQDGSSFKDIAIKFPWYDEREKICGVFGCSIILDQPKKYSVAESFSLLNQTGLLSLPSHVGNIPTKKLPCNLAELKLKLKLISNENFSMRELECLFYLLMGLSARETATKLHLSFRTVEHRLAAIKEKLFCQRKADIIIKLLQEF